MHIWKCPQRLIAAVLFVSFFEMYFPQSAAATDKSTQEIESRRTYFRVVGEVEFEGERIVYDEVIELRVDVGTISTMGLKKGDNRVLMSRLWVRRLLKSGGALLMEVPDGRGLFADLERTGQAPDAKWTPSYINHYFRPPDEFLPEFHWVDDVSRPSVIEAYISEAYYGQPAARLKINKPIQIEFLPRSADAEALALKQARNEPTIALSDRETWEAFMGLSISIHEIRQLAPKIAIELERNRAEGTSVLSKASSEELFAISGRDLKFSWGYRTRGDGVPQPHKYPDGHGILYRKSVGTTVDRASHVACNTVRQSCRLDDHLHGYVSFYQTDFGKGWTLEIGGIVHEVTLGQAIIDYSKERVVLIGVIER